MKFLQKLFVFLIVLVIVALLAKNMIVKAAVENGVSFVTGLDLKMASLNVGILNTKLQIKGLEIKNPKGFEEPVMLNMPEITVDYHLRDILKGKIHLETVVVDLKEFNVVKNKAGIVNLDSLKIAKEGKQAQAKPVKEPKQKGPAPQLQIDLLELRIGKVCFKDFSKSVPVNNDFEFNLNERHVNITNPQVLIAIILQKALLKASLAKISGFNLEGLSGTLTNAVGDLDKLAASSLGAVSGAAGDAMKTAQQLTQSVNTESLKSLGAGSVGALKGLGSSAGSGASTAADVTKDAVGSATNALKGLLGSKDSN